MYLGRTCHVWFFIRETTVAGPDALGALLAPWDTAGTAQRKPCGSHAAWGMRVLQAMAAGLPVGRCCDPACHTVGLRHT